MTLVAVVEPVTTSWSLVTFRSPAGSELRDWRHSIYELAHFLADGEDGGERMPTPTDINGSDPIEHLHVIVEEWLYGNVQGWLNSADVVHLEKYRHQAAQWLHRYFSPNLGQRDQQPRLPNLDHIAR